MRILWIGWSLGTLSIIHFLTCFLVVGVREVSGSRFKPEIRTKLLLSNIRSHLAKQVDEVIHEKECESGLVLCEPVPKVKVESDEDSEEVEPPPKNIGVHKLEIKVNPKDVIQSMIHKVHIQRAIEKHKKDHIDNVSNDENDDIDESESEDEDEDSEDVEDGEDGDGDDGSVDDNSNHNDDDDDGDDDDDDDDDDSESGEENDNDFENENGKDKNKGKEKIAVTPPKVAKIVEKKPNEDKNKDNEKITIIPSKVAKIVVKTPDEDKNKGNEKITIIPTKVTKIATKKPDERERTETIRAGSKPAEAKRSEGKRPQDHQPEAKPSGKPTEKSIKVAPPPSKPITKETVKEKKELQKEKKAAKVSKKRSTAKKPVDVDDDGVRFPKVLPVFSLAGNVVESELCRKHSRMYLRQLNRYRMWALLMYDASAKLPSGILQGNINQLGDFDECLTVNAVLKNKERRADDSGIQGRYCLAAIDVEATADEGALQQAVYKTLAYKFMQSEADDAGYFIPRFTTINWGLCVPDSCPPEDVERALIEELSDFNETSGIVFKVKVDGDACFDKDDEEFNFGLGTFITSFFYLTFIGIAGLATYRDLKFTSNIKTEPEKETLDAQGENEMNATDDMNTENSEEEKILEDVPENDNKEVNADEKQIQGPLQRLLMAFSLKRTTGELLKSGTDEDISCIHGIKALFTIMLYIGHRTAPISLTPFTNRIEFTKTTNESYSTLFRASLIYTDGFLLASGVLTSYNMTKEIEEHGRIAWLRRFLSRVIRLTPSLLAVVLFYGYIAEELGSGPLWGPLVGKNAELCRENLWKNLLYVQNFFEFEEMCAPQTHQLALDFQLSVIAPLLVYVLYKYDIGGLLILQLIYLSSSYLRYVVTYNNQLSLVFFHGISVSQLYRTANLLYTQAIYRATPYVTGVTIGYYLRKHGDYYRADKLQKPLIAIGWIVAICLGFLAVVTPIHLAARDYEYDASEAAQYAALGPISWSIALGWLIAACHLGYGGRFNDFLRSRPFVVLSRLSYSVYLIQFLVFNHYVGTIRAAKVFTLTEILNPFEITVILVLSIIVTLLFDIPMKDVKTILLERNKEIRASAEGEADAENDEETQEGNAVEKEPEANVEMLSDEDGSHCFDGPESALAEESEEKAIDDELEGDLSPHEDDEEDEDHFLRRSSRIRFDDDDEKEFWLEGDQQDPQAEEEEEDVENFWGEDED